MTLACSTRSQEARRGMKISAGRSSLSFATTRFPRNPAPPVTRTLLLDQKLMFHVGVHHHVHQFLEMNLRSPIQFAFRLGCIALKKVDFGRTIIPRIDFDKFL